MQRFLRRASVRPCVGPLVLCAGIVGCTPSGDRSDAGTRDAACPAVPEASVRVYCPPPFNEFGYYCSFTPDQVTDLGPCPCYSDIQPATLTTDRHLRYVFFSVVMFDWSPSDPKTHTFLYRLNLRDLSVTDIGALDSRPAAYWYEHTALLRAQGYSCSRDGDWGGMAVRTPCTVVGNRYAVWLRPTPCYAFGRPTELEHPIQISFQINPLCWETYGGYFRGRAEAIGEIWDVTTDSRLREIPIWFPGACDGRGAVSPFPRVRRRTEETAECVWPDLVGAGWPYGADPVHCRCMTDADCPSGPCDRTTEDGIRYCRCPSLAI